MKRNISLVSTAVALLFGGVLAFAQTQDTSGAAPRSHRGANREGVLGKMKERREAFKADLALTDAQSADIQKMREASRQSRQANRAAMQAARNDLRTLLSAEVVDERAVNAKVAEIQAAEGARVRLGVDSVLSLKRILTPEQQKKMAERREQRQANRARMGAKGQRLGDRLRQRMQKRRGVAGQGIDGLGLDADDFEFAEPVGLPR